MMDTLKRILVFFVYSALGAIALLFVLLLSTMFIMLAVAIIGGIGLTIAIASPFVGICYAITEALPPDLKVKVIKVTKGESDESTGNS